MMCEALRDDLIEFALGTLSGRSRSLVLDHLDRCAYCNAELESLAGVADTLLWLAPGAEPSLGFETRVVERLRGGETSRRARPRLRRISVFAAAAVMMAVLGVGVDALVTQGGSPQPSALRPTSSRLMLDGQVLGDVTISSGSPSWMVMNVDAGKLTGVVWCEVTFVNGQSQTIGKFTIANGYGSWTAPIRASGRRVRSARLVSVNGTVLARASFST